MDQRLVSGWKEIDEDHERILDLIDRFQHLQVGERAEAAEFLFKYVVEHCEREESYMVRLGYPMLTVHQYAHRWLHDLVVGEFPVLLREESILQIGKVIRDVFRTHILTLDAEFIEWAKANFDEEAFKLQ